MIYTLPQFFTSDADRDLPSMHDHTLAYLKALLERGELKAAVQTCEKAQGNDYDVLKKYEPEVGVFWLTREWKEYTMTNTDECIAHVRKCWNECSKEELTSFETGVIFRLNHTPWGGPMRSYTHEEAVQLAITSAKEYLKSVGKPIPE